MWSTLKISSGAQLGHDKRDIPAFDTILFHSNLSSLRRKYLSDVPKDKTVLSSGLKISKRPLKRRYWQLKNKERKCHFRFVVRRLLAAIIAPEARKERSCQSFSASHIGPRADCPFHRPASFRPDLKRAHRFENSTKYRVDDLCVNLVCEYIFWMLGGPHFFFGRSLPFLILSVTLKNKQSKQVLIISELKFVLDTDSC